MYAVFTGILPCSRPVLEVSTLPAAPASCAAGREVTPVELFRLLPAHFAAVLVCTLLGGILPLLPHALPRAATSRSPAVCCRRTGGADLRLCGTAING